MYLGRWNSPLKAALVHDIASYKLRGDMTNSHVRAQPLLQRRHLLNKQAAHAALCSLCACADLLATAWTMTGPRAEADVD